MKRKPVLIGVVLVGLLIVLLIVMILSKSKSPYIKGVYTTNLILNDNVVTIEVKIDKSGIADIRMLDLDDDVSVMYPLIESTFEDLASQICKNQSLENITYPDDSKYTAMILLDAIESALEKAKGNTEE